MKLGAAEERVYAQHTLSLQPDLSLSRRQPHVDLYTELHRGISMLALMARESFVDGCLEDPTGSLGIVVVCGRGNGVHAPCADRAILDEPPWVG